jgi:aminomethyltransferase
MAVSRPITSSSNGATKWDDIAHLREHLPDEVTLTHLDEQALIALQGPSAATALNRVMRGVPDSLTLCSR